MRRNPGIQCAEILKMFRVSIIISIVIIFHAFLEWLRKELWSIVIDKCIVVCQLTTVTCFWWTHKLQLKIICHDLKKLCLIARHTFIAFNVCHIFCATYEKCFMFCDCDCIGIWIYLWQCCWPTSVIAKITWIKTKDLNKYLICVTTKQFL